MGERRIAICFADGGEEGIRTLDALLTHTPLAGERLRPLGHLSTFGHIRQAINFLAFFFSHSLFREIKSYVILSATKHERVILCIRDP